MVVPGHEVGPLVLFAVIRLAALSLTKVARFILAEFPSRSWPLKKQKVRPLAITGFLSRSQHLKLQQGYMWFFLL